MLKSFMKLISMILPASLKHHTLEMNIKLFFYYLEKVFFKHKYYFYNRLIIHEIFNYYINKIIY